MKMEINLPSFLMGSSTQLNTAVAETNTFQPPYYPQMIVMGNNPSLYPVASQVMPVYTVTNESSPMLENSQLNAETEINSSLTTINSQQPQEIQQPNFFSSNNIDPNQYHVNYNNYNNCFDNFASPNAPGNDFGNVTINNIDTNLVQNNPVTMTFNPHVTTPNLAPEQNEIRPNHTKKNNKISAISSSGLSETKDVATNMTQSVNTWLNKQSSSQVKANDKRETNFSGSPPKRNTAEKELPDVNMKPPVRLIDILANNNIQNENSSLMLPSNFRLKPAKHNNSNKISTTKDIPHSLEIKNKPVPNELDHLGLKYPNTDSLGIEHAYKRKTQNKSTAEQGSQTEIYCCLLRNDSFYIANGDDYTGLFRLMTMVKDKKTMGTQTEIVETESSNNPSNDSLSETNTAMATENNAETSVESSSNPTSCTNVSKKPENFETESSNNPSDDSLSQTITAMATENNADTSVDSSSNPTPSNNVSKNKFTPKNVFDETLYTILGVYTPPKSVVKDFQMPQSSVELPDINIDVLPSVVSESPSVPSNIQNDFLSATPKTNSRSGSGVSIPSKVTPAFARVRDMVYEDIRTCEESDDYGNIPLHLAVVYEDLSKLKRQCIILKSIGSHLNQINFQNETALMVAVKLAVETANYAAISLLVTEGADQTIEDRDGYTPLHYAVKCGCVEIVRILLSAKDSHKVIEQFCHEGLVPLHQAAIEGHEEIIYLLLNKRVNVNIKDLKSGRTPYFHAIEMEQSGVAKILLMFGANPKLANYAGNLPPEYKHPQTHQESYINSGETNHTLVHPLKNTLNEGTNNPKIMNSLTESTSNCLCQHHLSIQDPNFVSVLKDGLSDSSIKSEGNVVNNSIDSQLSSMTNQAEMFDRSPNNSLICDNILHQNTVHGTPNNRLTISAQDSLGTGQAKDNTLIKQIHINKLIPAQESLGTGQVKDNILIKPIHINKLCDVDIKVLAEESSDYKRQSKADVKNFQNKKLTKSPTISKSRVKLTNLDRTLTGKHDGNSQYIEINDDLDTPVIKYNNNIPFICISDDETDDKPIFEDVKIEVIDLEDDRKDKWSPERIKNEENQEEESDHRKCESDSEKGTNEKPKEKECSKEDNRDSELVLEKGTNEKNKKIESDNHVDSGGADSIAVLFSTDSTEVIDTSDDEQNNSIDLHYAGPMEAVIGDYNGSQNKGTSSYLQSNSFLNVITEKNSKTKYQSRFQVTFNTIFSSVVGEKEKKDGFKNIKENSKRQRRKRKGEDFPVSSTEINQVPPKKTLRSRKSSSDFVRNARH